jgi:hypothetical protein
MISDVALQEFRALWREEFNEEISEEKAMEIAPKLLDLFNHIYRPIKKKWLEEDFEGGNAQNMKNENENNESGQP